MTKGFTLLELVVTLAIAAILAALAYPSYDRYVQRTYRAKAVEALLTEASRQERVYMVTRRYSHREPFEKASGRYRVEVDISTGDSGYTLSARPIGSQSDDACGTLQLTHQGERISEGDDQLCWTGKD